MRFTSTGKISYGPDVRIVLWVDQGISDYYRRLIPKYYYVKPQLYPAHVTVCRTGKESPRHMNKWGIHEGEEIGFEYSNTIYTDGKYWYLDVYSKRIGEIRVELGLPEFRFGDLGADRQCYHITIGNNK